MITDKKIKNPKMISVSVVDTCPICLTMNWDIPKTWVNDDGVTHTCKHPTKIKFFPTIHNIRKRDGKKE